LFSSNIIVLVLYLPIMTLVQSFRRELYRSRLTLKVMITDTLYLVFKHRFQLLLDCLTDEMVPP